MGKPNFLSWFGYLPIVMFIYWLPNAVLADLCDNVQIGTCDCEDVAEQLEIDCSYRELKTYPDIDKMYQSSIFSLDFSANSLSEMPELTEEFSELVVLDISQNEIVGDRWPDVKLPNVKVLRFDFNQIYSLSLVRSILRRFEGVETLSVSSNPLVSFSSYNISSILEAPLLSSLDLSGCKLTKVTGQHVLKGLPKLTSLNLSNNPLRSISDMISKSLTSLNLSGARLTFIQPNAFQNLPALNELNLSRNYRLSLSRNANEVVHSESVLSLDLSYCNMDTVDLSGFPKMTKVILRGNLISNIRKENFARNPDLEVIDLSYNAITHITSNSFLDTKQLKYLDLSYNLIRSIDRDTFLYQEQLTTINLSRNVMERFSRLASDSLIHLNVSSCEVVKIDLDAFNDLPRLTELDLSNNLFGDFPETLRSASLQTLDLSMCRLSRIRNTTFLGFPQLTRLRLAGNRFTTPFRVDFFDDNAYLRQIWLGDNPWRCDCKDSEMYKLFEFLDGYPAMLQDHKNLRCNSPDPEFGLTWKTACALTWYSPENQTEIGTTQRVWMFLMVAIIVVSISVCVIMSIRRCWEARKMERNEEQRERNLAEAREIMRRNRSILDQEAQLNAPDPRETHPPCYEEAILLPKFSGSFASLRGKFKIEDYDDVDSSVARRHRCRSEEVLSQRGSVVDTTRPNRRQIIAEANNRISVFPLLEIPPRTVEPSVAIAEIPVSDRERIDDSDLSDDVSFIETGRNLETFDNTQPSPYAQRRTQDIQKSNGYRRAASGELEIFENHYAIEVSNIRDDCSSVDSTSFTVINQSNR